MIELIKITDIDNDEAEAIFNVSAKATVEIEIRDGEWVSDIPVGLWFEPKSAYGNHSNVWKTDSNDEIPNAYIMDGESFYEVVCEDLVNVPEIEALSDGTYRIESDAAVDVLMQNIKVSSHIGYDYDSYEKKSYSIGYDAYDASEAENVIINVYNDNIKISEVY